MTDEQRNTLCIELGNIIGRYAAWLTAADFLEAAEQATAGYLDYQPITVDQVVELMEQLFGEDSAKQAEG